MAEKTLSRLVVHKLADTSEGTRVVRFDAISGEKQLVNPETNAVEPWPLAGVRVLEKPEYTLVPMSWVAKARAEGWVSVEGERVEHRPGGPVDNKWAVTHSFVHLDAITIHAEEGDVTYNVVHQPDKYADDSTPQGPKRLAGGNTFTDEDSVTEDLYDSGNTRVDWFYELELED